ncbi:MAG TPA: L,D-transpeptidase [Longimicrobiaceae bacterium]|nr:L,D-transpeptidase [Longimicrobiaceae bacterium]
MREIRCPGPACCAILLLLGTGTRLVGQQGAHVLGRPAPSTVISAAPPWQSPGPEAADADSVLREAERDPGQRLIVSVRDRRLWWMVGPDVLLATPVAVGKGSSLSDGTTTWEFRTPPGVRRVIRKEPNPVWVPPEWHYVELAQDSSWSLVHLSRGAGVALPDGSRVVVHGERVGRELPDGRFEPVPPADEVIFGDTLFVPPADVVNRRITGELGAYELDLGGGYLIHGTPDKESIGRPTTHGCIRVGDAALELLYREVPAGTPVYIY